MVLKNLVAKKYSNGDVVSLYDHSIAVAEKSLELAQKLNFNEEFKGKFEKSCYIAGLLHDIGKSAPSFQKYINGDDKVKYVYHNIMGALMLKNYLSTDANGDIIKCVIKCALYHYPFNEDYGKNVNDSDYHDCKKILAEYADIIKEKYTDFNLSFYDIERFDNTVNDIVYFDAVFGRTITDNMLFYSVINVVKYADAMITNIDDISDLIEKGNNVTTNDIVKPASYDDRFNVQFDYAKKLSKLNASVFCGQTGFGKTMMGVLYSIAANNKKTYWVCPRNSITESVYQGVKNELKQLHLDDKVSVGLLMTNEWKEKNADKPDIIVTNIDSFLNPIVKSNESLYRTYDMLFCNCIFDEFHEYVTDSPIMALYEIVTKSRLLCGNTNSLFLSATPIDNLFPKSFCENFNNTKFIHEDEKINNRKYRVHFVDHIEDIVFNDKACLITTNATRTCQDHVSSKIADKTLHSRFFEKDKDRLFNELLNEYGKRNLNGVKNTRWSTTNIVNTGVDVSFNSLVIVAPSPNSFIQSCGRCNRWDDGKIHDVYFVKLDGKDKSETKSLSERGIKWQCELMYDLLKKYFGDGEVVTFKKLYDVNNEFYKEYEGKFTKYYGDILTESYQNMSKRIQYSFDVKKEVSNNKGKKFTCSNALRDNGKKNSFFIKIRKADTGEYIESDLYNGDDTVFNFKYAFNEAKDRRNFENDIVKTIKKYKVYDKYFKHKKHENKITDKLDFFIKSAKCSETPLYIPSIWYYDEKLGVIKTL